MVNVLKIIGAIAGSYLVGFLVWVGVQNAIPEKSLGSVVQGSEYKVTTTISTMAAGNYYLTNTTTDMVTRGSAGVLGSIVITSSSNTGFSVFDANAVGTTTLAVFEQGAAEGTYTFDVSLYRGLGILVPANFNGVIATTYRVQ